MFDMVLHPRQGEPFIPKEYDLSSVQPARTYRSKKT